MSALERVKAMLSVVTRLPLNEKERREVADIREVVALAERAAELEARMKSLLEDAQATSDLDDEAHRLLDFALGEGEPETTSMETVAGRLPRLIAERDEARAEVERLRRSLVDLTGDKSAGDLPEKTVLGVLVQRDEARAQAASALRHADLLRREMEPCEVHHGARRACGQCLSSAEAHAKDLLAQLATEREAHARTLAALSAIWETAASGGSVAGDTDWAAVHDAIAAAKVTP